ncbi:MULTISPECIES: hypothetical protein [Streptomyces]|uniref:Uncharacterized protein n=1 Tax=Streptomyces flaveolus TaxID=67297 RepID=A0ABV3A6H3_9ACTN|nr:MULTISPECIES: hypothetical protein [Streptomyces]KOG60007.1 hypothetical protein ADK77_37450 [Streptomyces antibioticus]
MSVPARLRAVVPALLPSAEADVPELLGPPGRRLLAQRGDDALWVQPLDDAFAPAGDRVRLPAPWPRRRGTWAVAPDASLAVFAGVHAVRAVEPSGATRWEVRHGCWYGACREQHTSYEEYGDRADHRYPEGGSAGFSVDGAYVWAHLRAPLAVGELGPDVVDEWLLLDARDGRVLARADAEAAAAGSFHLPHPVDPGQMGLSIGEGQDGAPLRWGRWDGTELSVRHVAGDLTLMGVSPSGERLLTVTHDQDTLAVRDTDGSVPEGLEWDAGTAVPRHPEAEPDNDEALPYWDWAGGFLDGTTLICSTVEADEEWGEGRHWLLGMAGARTPVEVDYPVPVGIRPPMATLGDGRWVTPADSGEALYVWERG